MFRDFLAVVLCLCLLSGSVVRAANAGTVVIKHAQDDLPTIKIYAELVDEYGLPLETDFKRVKGFVGDSAVPIKEIKNFAVSEEGVAVTYLVDISKSLSLSDFDQVRRTLKLLIEQMNENDYAAIVTFGNDVQVVQGFSRSKENLLSKAGGLSPTDDNTQFYKGLARAQEVAQTVDSQLPVRRAIVVISDGQEDSAAGMSAGDVFQNMRIKNVSVQAIGIFTPPLTDQQVSQLSALREFAKYSGGAYYQSEVSNLTAICHDVMKRIRSGFVLLLDASAVRVTDGVYPIKIEYTAADKVTSDSVKIRLRPVDTSKSQQVEQKPKAYGNGLWWLLGMAVLGTAVIAALYFYKRRHQHGGSV